MQNTQNTTNNNPTSNVMNSMNPTANNHPNLNEKELLNDLLNQEKQLVSSYSMAITEASCPNLRNVLSTQFNQSTQDQFKVFDHMRQRGYYPTKDAQDADVQQAKQKFQTMQSELS